MDDSGRNTNVEALVAPLFESMKVRVTDEELQRIKDAFAFAREAHKKQRRKSGEPYIVHPISVARIVGEEMMLDANTVCAAPPTRNTPNNARHVTLAFPLSFNKFFFFIVSSS